MHRIALFVISALVTCSLPAQALTLRDLMALARAGVSDEVLIALIQVDSTIYALEPAQIIDLKGAGVSDRVIVAVVRNGRERPEARPAPPTPASGERSEPGLVVIGREPANHHTTMISGMQGFGHSFVAHHGAIFVPVVVAVPVVVPTEVAVVGVEARPPFRGFGRFINDGFVDAPSPLPAGTLLFGGTPPAESAPRERNRGDSGRGPRASSAPPGALLFGGTRDRKR